MHRSKPRITLKDKIIGQRFGSWLVLSITPIELGKWRHLCRCDCGIEKNILSHTLSEGTSTKCRECELKRTRKPKLEKGPKRSFKGELNPSYKHGMNKTTTYRIWSGMLSRCYNEKVKIYKYYGGRGITVCNEWHEFINFYNDMGERPLKLQLDRIDNDKGYFKENCRWVTSKENNPSNKGDIPDDMPGKTFGEWKVLSKVIHKPGHLYYLCRCSCGLEKIKSGGELRQGATRCLTCSRIARRKYGNK